MISQKKDMNLKSGRLDEVPSHWSIKRFKYYFELLTQKSNEDLPKVALENIESKTGRYIPNESKFEGTGVHFKKNDILYGKLRPYLAKVFLSDFEGTAVGDFFVFRPNSNVLPSYAFRAILNHHFITITNSSTFGAKMPRVSWDFISNLQMAFPPLGEQEAIANFLDEKTSQIDQSIEKRTQLIELLKEERSAVINDAVTRGIDPNFPMKDSGIEWLGDIPEHWDCKKFKYVAQIRGGQVDPKSQSYQNKVMIAPNHIETGTTKILNYETAKEQGAISGKYLIKPRDVIYSKIRPNLRKVCIVDFDGLCSADMYAIASLNGTYPRFLLYHLITEAFSNFMIDRSLRVAMPKVNREDFNDYILAIPSIAEQKAIVQHIESETSRIDKEIELAEKEIELLKEYREALISEAVTGKIDVWDYPLN